MAVDAQVASTRRPISRGILIRPEPMTQTAPTAEQQNNFETEGISDVEVTFDGNKALITFRARPNVSPTVEVGAERPVKGLGGQLEFKTRAGFSYAKSGPGQTSYRAEFAGLDPGERIYYLITIAGYGDTGTRQTRGYFDMPY
jgi:hypothetical protein